MCCPKITFASLKLWVHFSKLLQKLQQSVILVIKEEIINYAGSNPIPIIKKYSFGPLFVV